MRKTSSRSYVLCLCLLLILSCLIPSGCSKKETQSVIEPPVAEKIPKELTIHDQTRIDDYYWLKEREDPKVIDYLTAENKYLDSMMKSTEEFKENLFQEIIGRIEQTDMSVPYKKRGYYYYSRYEEGNEYSVYCRKKGSLEADEEILLNVNEMAAGFDYYDVSGLEVSPDTNLIAFGVDTVSRRKYTIRFKDLRTGEMLSDEIPNTTGNPQWANDNTTVFYSRKDESLRPFKVFKHVLGNDVTEDELVFHEEDVTFNAYMGKSKSEKYIVIASISTLSTEYRMLDADAPEGSFSVFHPRESDLEYHIDHIGDEFYIRTNANAKNFRLMKTPVGMTGKDNWTEVIAHREEVLLEGFELFKDFLVLSERKGGLTHLRIIEWVDQSEHYLDFGEETYTAGISRNPEFDTDLLRFSYTSLTTPQSTYDYDMNSREKTLLKRQKVVGDFDPSNYMSERLWAKAGNGVEVPISLVYKKGLKKNGKNPLVLYGYGSYGYSMDPMFQSPVLSLLDRGFVFAMAHIRGGSDLGRSWYEDGKLLKKKNTFTDFIACADHLIDLKFTRPDSLFAMGGSAGGLLMGAIVNMRPDLFKGIIAQVPWVDVITTMLDPSIPLTTSEYDEWGNPNNREYYDYMLSYSPYDQVEAKDYPAMLVTTGLHDSQVQYWEPAKWVAKLRAMKTDDNLLLLHTNMEAGHSGVSGRFRQYREMALEFVFIFHLLGIEE
ncbi:S9 family peptidase [Acidobacteriota bacterium]